MTKDLFSDDLASLSNDELYLAIERFAKAQPSEGWRHEYREAWSDAALEDVAAMANTFGGLILIGVKKDKTDTSCEFPGVETELEYKTRIASSVAANLAPIPAYQIFECLKPGAPNRRFCVIRIRESKALHLVTKKGLSPVHIRNEDETRQANAEQLRRLIERERLAAGTPQRVSRRAEELRDSMQVNFSYADRESEHWRRSQRVQSSCFLKIQVIPSESLVFELDALYENAFRNLIEKTCVRFRDNVREGVANFAEERTAVFYEYAAYHKLLDYESSWRMTEAGEIGFATQIGVGYKEQKENWSLVDLAYYLILFCRLAIGWWESIGYFGDGTIYAQISVGALKVARHAENGWYTHGFDPTFSPHGPRRQLDIRRDAIALSAAPRNSASTYAKLTYSGNSGKLVSVATSLLNQLLRSLGHLPHREILQDSVASLAQIQPN